MPEQNKSNCFSILEHLLPQLSGSSSPSGHCSMPSQWKNPEIHEPEAHLYCEGKQTEKIHGINNFFYFIIKEWQDSYQMEKIEP